MVSALSWRIDFDRLEATLERPILLDALAIFGWRGGADAANLAARQRRLQDVGGIERAPPRIRPRPACATLVDEDDDVQVARSALYMIAFEALFELTAILLVPATINEM